MAPGLLAPSDDSDGDCERRPQRRRFFQKSERGSRKLLLDAGISHCVLLCIFTVSLIFVAVNIYSLTKKHAELSESLSVLSALPSKMRALEVQLNRMLVEFDLWREYPSSNQTRGTTEYIYDALERLSAEANEIKKKIAATFTVTEDAIRRLSTVETRCLNVCRTPILRKEKPRRRQAAKLPADDEIIFRRN